MDAELDAFLKRDSTDHDAPVESASTTRTSTIFWRASRTRRAGDFGRRTQALIFLGMRPLEQMRLSWNQMKCNNERVLE
jgi:hypothetical protein